MGNQCSQCQCNQNKEQELINQINHSQQQETNPASDENKIVVSHHGESESKTIKNKKRVQIVMPVRQIQDTTDNVVFRTSKIEESDFGQITKTLRKHFILSQLQQKQIHYLIGDMRYCVAKHNQYVFKQGDPSFSYYIILEGRCSVEINGEKKKVLGFGDAFGDLGIIYNAPRSASILTLQNCLFAELSRKNFKKVTEDINSMFEKENRGFLETVDFYKQMNEDEKNAIAGDCLTETYEEGQVIFNKGDDANCFYVIRQGIVTKREKEIDLKEFDSFGKQCILHDQIEQSCLRGYTAIAKIKTKLLSMNKEVIRKNLGENLTAIMRRKQALKIIKQSSIYSRKTPEDWEKAINSIDFEAFKKNDIVFEKGHLLKKDYVYLLIGSDLKREGEQKPYFSHSVLEPDESLNGYDIVIRKKCTAENNGFIGKIKTIKKVVFKQDENNLGLENLFVVKKLRGGNFGQVYAVCSKDGEKRYALKVVDREEVETSNLMKYIMNEEEALREAPPHPFLIKFYKLLKDSNYLYFLMHLIEGQDMFDAISTLVPMQPEIAGFYALQLLMVLEHLHRNRYVYRDLKPENVMLNQDGYLVLVDMGTAKKLNINQRFKTSTIIGTPHYMAPEIISGKGYSFPVDLWSLGVVLYQFLIGKLPFADLISDPMMIYQDIMKQQVKYPRGLEPNSKAILSRFLGRNPMHRLGNGYDQLKKHIFFKGIQWKKLSEKKQKPPFYPRNHSKIKPMEIQKAVTKTGSMASNYFLAKKK